MAVRVPKSTRTSDRDETGEEVIDLRDGPVEFEELLEHRQALLSLCQRIVGDAATADDMVQETYLRALKNLDQLERRPSLLPWLTTVAKRRSIDELRARRRIAPVDELPDVAASAHDDPETRVPGGDAVRQVREAIRLLNDRERRLLGRQVNDGLSLAELAEEDDSTVDSVRSVLVRARAKLRQAITADVRLPAAAPLAGIGTWARRRVQAVNLRVQQAFSTTPFDRVGEVVAAGLVTLTLGATPSVVDSGAPSGAPEARRETVSATTQPVPSSPPDDALPDSADRPPADSGVPATPTNPLVPEVSGESLPGSGAVDLLLPPDGVEGTDDAAFTSFAVGMGDGTTVLAAGTRRQGCVTGCTVLFRSLDAGGSWERLAADGITGTTVVAAPGYPADPRVFAVGDGGLSVSRDGGASFEFVLPTGAAPLALSPTFATGDERVFVGTGPALVWDEATRSATPLLGPPVSASTHFAFERGYPSPGNLLIGSAAPGSRDFEAAVYRCRYALSEDSCVEATRIPEFDEPPRVAVLGTSGTVLAWAGPRIRRSTDGAASFGTTGVPDGIHVGDLASDGRGATFAAAHSPSGSAAGVLRSTDDGRSWHVVGSDTALVHGVATVAALPGGRILAAPLAQAGGDIYCSRDGGATWSNACD
jgi:RNA polymerase sigma-70 factor (ECF subfamily)